MDRSCFNNRKQIRLKGYDYSTPGAYFVTICCKDQHCYFGWIESREIKLSHIGQIVKRNWERIPRHFKNVRLDTYVIMPNHLHGIIYIINNENGSRDLINQIPTMNQTPTMNYQTPAINSKTFQNRKSSGVNNWILMKNPDMTLGKIIRYYKSKTTRFIRQNGYKNFAW